MTLNRMGLTWLAGRLQTELRRGAFAGLGPLGSGVGAPLDASTVVRVTLADVDDCLTRLQTSRRDSTTQKRLVVLASDMVYLLNVAIESEN